MYTGGRTRRGFSGLRTLGWLVVVMMLVMAVMPTAVAAADGDVEIIQDNNTNGCNGVVTTPGSENTDKQLIGGSLEPGGTARFLISYPVDPEDVSGREQFEITDCVFIGDDAVAKYFIHFVPNTEDFELEFTLEVPDDAPIGDEYCNYAKTTAAPSDSQASNRKAGPACFIVGGALRVEKVDGNGDPLAGADFHVECTWPTRDGFLADTIINANGNSETINSTSGGSFSRNLTTGSDGVISIQAPVGTECTFTETDAPNGYDLPADDECTLTVELGEQGECEFVNLETPSPTPTPTPEAVILVLKTIDADGNLETTDDQTPGEGWEFELDLEDGDIEEAFPVTDEDGFAGWLFTLPIDGTNATVTEQIQDNFELIDAFCVDAGGFAEPEALRSRINAEGDIVGELDGDSVSFPVEAETAYICFFTNSPEPEDSVQGETATPEITLPPTDAFGGAASPTNESWRIMLVVMAGILASVLILTPSPATRRK